MTVGSLTLYKENESHPRILHKFGDFSHKVERQGKRRKEVGDRHNAVCNCLLVWVLLTFYCDWILSFLFYAYLCFISYHVNNSAFNGSTSLRYVFCICSMMGYATKVVFCKLSNHLNKSPVLFLSQGRSVRRGLVILPWTVCFHS